jgi:hypothetical protein
MKDMALKKDLRTAIREKAKPARFDCQYRPHLGLTDAQQVASSLHAVAVKRATLSLKLHCPSLDELQPVRITVVNDRTSLAVDFSLPEA